MNKRMYIYNIYVSTIAKAHFGPVRRLSEIVRMRMENGFELKKKIPCTSDKKKSL
jgi:hypothetical protein